MRPISSRQVTGVLLVVLSGWSLTMTAQDGRDGWIVLLLAGRAGVLVAVYDGAQRRDFSADGVRRDLAGVAADGGTARVRGDFGTAWRAAACALGAADGVAGRAGPAAVAGAELEAIGFL